MNSNNLEIINRKEKYHSIKYCGRNTANNNIQKDAKED